MIPFVDLKAQYTQIGEEVEAAVIRALRSGRYALGPEVDAFEQEFARHAETAHAVGVSSGTSALLVALGACGVGPGDEVITVPFTFEATISTILQVGARARLVDIDPATLTMDPGALDQAVTERTKAVIPVHLYGQPADMDPILDVARRHGLLVIEDAAQAVGARYKGRRVGGLGDVGCFSFYPSKNLGAAGEGGIVVTNDPERARRARLLRAWGQEVGPEGVLRGGNYRLDGVQGAVLRVKLRYLDAWTRARQSLAARYTAALAGVVDTPCVMPYAVHTFNVYGIRTAARDTVREKLEADGVGTGIHYRTPVHLQPAYASLGYGPGSFIHAETAAAEVLSLPVYPELTELQQHAVVSAVRRAVARTLD